jgi:hypothetical protein
VRADRAGPALEGLGADRRATTSGRACAKPYPVVRAVRSESDGGDQTWETDVREAVPVVRAIRSESDGGDQTRETDGCGRHRSSLRR